MTRLIVVTCSAVGLILFVSFIITRLLRARSRGLSIRMQVFLALATIIGTFAFGLGVLVIDRVESRAQRLAEAAAHDEAQALAALITSEMQRTQVSLPELAHELSRWLPSVQRFSSSPAEPAGLEILTPEGALLFPSHKNSKASEKGAVFVDIPLLQDGELQGTVRVVKPTLVVEALLADFAPTVLVISLILGATAAVAAAWIGRTIAAPIESLSRFAERVSAGERTALPGRVTGREVIRLVQSIDTMQRKLEGRPFVETFAADLSHELKNPVAAIRASAEVLTEGALEEPEQAKKFVSRILEASERIEKLLAELLHLARVETRGPEKLTRLDFAQLLRDVRESYPQTEQRLVFTQAEGSYLVRGDEMWLTRALANLLDNAHHHSPAGTPIRLQLLTQSSYLLLRIQNEGAIAPHIQPDLFRRFVTTRRDRGGTGLGLAIVRAVAEAHGGQINILQAGPPSVALELRLPLS